MEGDLAPVAELVELSRRFDCFLLLDEAHATGVLGDRGRGVTELLPAATQLDPNTMVKVGTLSKALGSQGGFVCGSHALIKWLVNHARPYIFSTALAPPAAGAARAALAIIEAEPEQRLRLRQLAAFFRDQLRALGLEASRSQSQIVPIVVGEAHTASRFAGRLRRKGLLVPAIRPPSVPQGSARLRVSLTAGHTEDDVLRLVSALQDNRGDLTGNACHAERSRGHRLP